MDRVERNVDVIGGVEPTAPEPVEIGARGLFDRAEKVGRGRTLELPAACVFAHRKVKAFATDDRVAQDVIGSRRLAIGVGTKVQNAVRMRHDRNLVLRGHVADEIARQAAGPGHIRIPLVARDAVEERVDALVHPGPGAFIGVDRHREINVADLVDHDADEEDLLAFRIGARAIVIQIGARTVEGDHRVFHPADRTVDRLSGGIGIIKAEARIDLHRVNDRGG